MSDRVDFTFLTPHSKTSVADGPVREMADVLGNGRVIQNVKDLVERVTVQLAKSRGKIGRLIFAGHAGKGYFYIGKDLISHLTVMGHAQDLLKLAPHFAPGARVTLYSCETAYNAVGMYYLSLLWPGVSIEGWTKGVSAVFDDLAGDHIEGRGLRIVCTMTGCSGNTPTMDAARQLIVPPSIPGL